MRSYRSCYPEAKPVFEQIEHDDTTVVICNIETTGLDPAKDKIIQVSAAKCRIMNRKFHVLGGYNAFITPKGGITEMVPKFTGKTAEFWSRQKDIGTVMKDLVSFMGRRPVIISWSASEFVVPFLVNAGFTTGHMIYPVHAINIYKIAQSVSPKTRDFTNYSFRSIAEKEGVKIKYKEKGHDSRYDVNGYIELLNMMYPLFITGDEPVKIKSLQYFEKSVYVQRLYFKTDHGSFYIDGLTGFICEATVGFFDKVDADALYRKLQLGYHEDELQEVVRKYYIRNHQKSA